MGYGSSDDDEEIEVLGVRWGRWTWTFFLVLLWAVVVLGWKYYPIPGYDRDLWWVFLGIGASIIAVVFPSAFIALLASKWVLIGDSVRMTVNMDAFNPKSIPWADKDGKPIIRYRMPGETAWRDAQLKRGRTGGISFLGLKGKDWPVWLDFPGAVVEKGPLLEIQVDCTPFPLTDLPDAVRSEFVKGGRSILPGYHPKRSRIFFGVRPLVRGEVPEIHVRWDAAQRAEASFSDRLERKLRTDSRLARREESPLVRIVDRDEERRRENLNE